MEEVPRRSQTRERNDRANGEDVMRWGVIPMQFHFITYGMELYNWQYTDKHV